MKLLMEVSNKDHLFFDNVDGIILPLEGYSVESVCSFTMEEIKEISSKSNIEVFIKMNKNFMNEDIEAVRSILLEIDSLSIQGVFFYDLAILELKRELSLKVDLVWNQTHMVNNYKTCNYYHSKGVEYALLGKEITLDEILEIVSRSDITSMVEVVSCPSVAFSKRKLITNYYQDLGKNAKREITIQEKVTDTPYRLMEDENGTSFFLSVVTNGTSIIKDLYDFGTPYIIIREFLLEDVFVELIQDTYDYIKNGCVDTNYVNKYRKLGDSTNFFFKRTIYKVKKS